MQQFPPLILPVNNSTAFPVTHYLVPIYYCTSISSSFFTTCYIFHFCLSGLYFSGQNCYLPSSPFHVLSPLHSGTSALLFHHPARGPGRSPWPAVRYAIRQSRTPPRTATHVAFCGSFPPLRPLRSPPSPSSPPRRWSSDSQPC